MNQVRPRGANSTHGRTSCGHWIDVLLCELVPLRRWSHLVTKPDHSGLNNFGDQPTAVKENLFETCSLPGELARSLARVTVSNAMKTRRTNLKLTSDEPHELNTFDEQVAATIPELEPASFEENRIHESDLAAALATRVETSFTGGVAISL